MADEFESLGNELRDTREGVYRNSGNAMSLVLSGQFVGSLIRLYQSLLTRGAPPQPARLRSVGDSQVAVMWPANDSWFEWLFAGTGKQRGELWVQKGKPTRNDSSLSSS